MGFEGCKGSQRQKCGKVVQVEVTQNMLEVGEHLDPVGTFGDSEDGTETNK